jgi:signal transduction histidine kinase
VRVTLDGDEAEVRFEVSNSGPAIEQSTLDLMFEPLKRGLHNESRDQSEGSLGLGLYISREIIKSHRGRHHREVRPERNGVLGAAASPPLVRIRRL